MMGPPITGRFWGGVSPVYDGAFSAYGKANPWHMGGPVTPPGDSSRTPASQSRQPRGCTRSDSLEKILLAQNFQSLCGSFVTNGMPSPAEARVDIFETIVQIQNRG